MMNKATCGWLDAWLGVLATVITRKAGTAAAILALLALLLIPSLMLLPWLAVMLNGTSSVLRLCRLRSRCHHGWMLKQVAVSWRNARVRWLNAYFRSASISPKVAVSPAGTNIGS